MRKIYPLAAIFALCFCARADENRKQSKICDRLAQEDTLLHHRPKQA